MENKTNINKFWTAWAFEIIVSAMLFVIFANFNVDRSFSGVENMFSKPRYASTLALMGIFIVLMVCVAIYTYSTRHTHPIDHRGVLMIMTILILTFVISAAASYLVNLYVMPICLSTLLIAAIVDKKTAMFSNIFFNIAVFLSYTLIAEEYSLALSGATLIANIASGTIMVVLMVKNQTRFRYLMSGILAGLFVAPLPMLTLVSTSVIDPIPILFSGFWAFIATILSVTLFMIVLPFMEVIFKIKTDFRLSEFCSFDNPLLKRLQKEAPGTFSHSLQVANIAELCATSIGENGMLARVAGYYHDVGKLKNPEFFVENQKEGYNPHDELIPEVSVSMITKHTKYGYELLKKAGLGEMIANLAVEHHGTTPVQYFYKRVQYIAEDKIKEAEFSYEGPKPQNKISAILMIADSVEAATRAVGVMEDQEKFRAFVHNIIKGKIDQNQFSDCDITFKELETIEKTLVDSLPHQYHKRVDYNKRPI